MRLQSLKGGFRQFADNYARFNAVSGDDHTIDDYPRKSSDERAWQRPHTAAHGVEARRKRLGFAAHGPGRYSQIEKQKPCVARPGWLP